MLYSVHRLIDNYNVGEVSMVKKKCMSWIEKHCSIYIRSSVRCINVQLHLKMKKCKILTVDHFRWVVDSRQVHVVHIFVVLYSCQLLSFAQFRCPPIDPSLNASLLIYVHRCCDEQKRIVYIKIFQYCMMPIPHLVSVFVDVVDVSIANLIVIFFHFWHPSSTIANLVCKLTIVNMKRQKKERKETRENKG